MFGSHVLKSWLLQGVPAQLGTKAVSIPVAQVSAWENLRTVSFLPKHCMSHHHMEKLESEFVNSAVTRTHHTSETGSFTVVR